MNSRSIHTYLVFIFLLCAFACSVQGEERHSQLILSEEEKNRLNQDLATIDKMINESPDKAGPWLYRANTLFNLERYEETLKALDEAERLNPNEDTVGAMIIRGKTLYMLGRDDEAIETFDKAINLSEEDYKNALVTKEQILERMGQ